MNTLAYKPITIKSLKSDPYNSGDHDRDVMVTGRGQDRGVHLRLTNCCTLSSGPGIGLVYYANLSRKAATELMMALDLILSDSENDEGDE